MGLQGGEGWEGGGLKKMNKTGTEKDKKERAGRGERTEGGKGKQEKEMREEERKWKAGRPDWGCERPSLFDARLRKAKNTGNTVWTPSCFLYTHHECVCVCVTDHISP